MLEAKSLADNPRPYLGMSAIGEECYRKLWYSFRWATPPSFDAVTLKRFDDGHRTEDLIVSRLSMAPDVLIDAVDSTTGKQFEFVDVRGHFKGHSDGRIQGIYEAPKTTHVLEIKCCNEKKVKELEGLRISIGDKNALKAWNPTYYAQHVLYMHYEGFSRGYLVCATPGGREWTSCRTNADPAEACRLIAKADAIILSENPPPRAYHSKTFYACGWCAYKDVCYGDAPPDRNCRTCLFSKPVDDGQWACAKHGIAIPEDEQRKAHECHRYVPSLVPIEQTDAAEDGSWIQYGSWIDKGPGS